MSLLREIQISVLPEDGNSRNREYLVALYDEILKEPIIPLPFFKPKVVRAPLGYTKNEIEQEGLAEQYKDVSANFMAELICRLAPKGGTLCLLPGGDLLNWALKKLSAGERFVHSSDFAAMMVSPSKETVREALHQAPNYARNTLIFCCTRRSPEEIPHGYYEDLEAFAGQTAGTLTHWQAKPDDDNFGLNLCSTSFDFDELEKTAQVVAEKFGARVAVAGEMLQDRMIRHLEAEREQANV